MSDNDKAFLVTWKRQLPHDIAPSSYSIGSALSMSVPGGWNVLSYPDPSSRIVHSKVDHDEFVNDCLKHIPPAFWKGHGREEIVLIYLSAVDDAMELIAENIASRIAKEVT